MDFGIDFTEAVE